MKTLIDSQHRVLAALVDGDRAHYMSHSRSSDAYWFLSSTHERCTMQIPALVEARYLTRKQEDFATPTVTPSKAGIAYIAANPYVAKKTTWYHAKWGLDNIQIETVQVSKSSEHFLTINGRRVAKANGYGAHYPTRKGAVDALIKHYEWCVRGAEGRLKLAKRDLAKAQALAETQQERLE